MSMPSICGCTVGMSHRGFDHVDYCVMTTWPKYSCRASFSSIPIGRLLTYIVDKRPAVPQYRYHWCRKEAEAFRVFLLFQFFCCGKTIFRPSENDEEHSFRRINLKIVVSYPREVDSLAIVSTLSVDVERSHILRWCQTNVYCCMLDHQ